MPAAPVAVAVMTKFPAPGRVKTRLLPHLTPAEAAAVHRTFLLHLTTRLATLNLGDLVICHDPPDAAPAFRDLSPTLRTLAYLPQSPGDLGHRLATAFNALTPTHPRVLFLGTDSPDLPDAHLRSAAQLTATADVTLGPTDDGGYWCLGLRKSVDPHRLLADIPWSSGHEAAATLHRAAELGYNTLSASPWPDVDRAADLDRLLARLAASTEPDDRTLLSNLRPILQKATV